MTEYIPQFTRLFSRNPQLSNIKPSEWAEKNIIIPGKGRLSYDFNPYCREVIDCFADDHPARVIAIMKGSQITFSSGVLYPLIGYTIAQRPRNSLITVGKSDLLELAAEKLDLMISGAKLQSYLKYAAERKKNNKSGDTDYVKQFTNGYVKLTAITNHKSVAQMDLDLLLLDDYEMMKSKSKDGGDVKDLLEMRAASNKDTYKMGLISTPLVSGNSNIETAYLAGDQRRYFVECPCCHEPIIFKWVVAEGEVINPLTNDVAKGAGGMVYERNNHDQIIEKSVGYICYKCAGFFTDKNKQKQIREAIWRPTAIPSSPVNYSYHISSLYAPTSMFGWIYYANKHKEATPPAQPVDEYKMQTLVNTCFGETYQSESQSLKAEDLQKNQRDYPIGVIPEKLAQRDGNGRFVLLTIGSDINGTVMGVNGARENDARLDYEIVGWTETGASYSICHGSIGTFVPRERAQAEKKERKKWTYEPGKPNSVWQVFTEIIRKVYVGDMGRKFTIHRPGIDVGAYTDFVMPYIDWTIKHYQQNPVIGLRGQKEEEFVIDSRNTPLFTIGKVRADVFYLQVGLIKDTLSSYSKLRWDTVNDTTQPANFMNYPMSQLYVCPAKAKYNEAMGVVYEGDFLYQKENFFSHYEAERRMMVQKPGGGEAFRWAKFPATAQNHMLDCRVYNMAIKEIVTRKLGQALSKENNIPANEFVWADFVAYQMS
jgi:phage terminase large subunit GpA-like protein